MIPRPYPSLPHIIKKETFTAHIDGEDRTAARWYLWPVPVPDWDIFSVLQEINDQDSETQYKFSASRVYTSKPLLYEVAVWHSEGEEAARKLFDMFYNKLTAVMQNYLQPLDHVPVWIDVPHEKVIIIRQPELYDAHTRDFLRMNIYINVPPDYFRLEEYLNARILVVSPKNTDETPNGLLPATELRHIKKKFKESVRAFTTMASIYIEMWYAEPRTPLGGIDLYNDTIFIHWSDSIRPNGWLFTSTKDVIYLDEKPSKLYTRRWKYKDIYVAPSVKKLAHELLGDDDSV